MALININADFTKLVRTMERIADALERLSPPPNLAPSQPSTEDDLYEIVYTSDEVSLPEDEEWRNYAPRSNY